MLISRKQYFCLKRFVIVITSTIRTCLTSAVFNSFTATACNLSLTYLSSNRFPYSLETFRVLFDVFFLDNVIFMKACFSFFFCMRRLGCGKSPLKETTISSIISLATKFLSRRLSFLIEFSEIVKESSDKPSLQISEKSAFSQQFCVDLTEKLFDASTIIFLTSRKEIWGSGIYCYLLCQLFFEPLWFNFWFDTLKHILDQLLTKLKLCLEEDSLCRRILSLRSHKLFGSYVQLVQSFSN